MVVEKTLGHDLTSLHEINGVLTEQFKEQQLYRIDHFLGKETVQNILRCALPTRSSNRYGSAGRL